MIKQLVNESVNNLQLVLITKTIGPVLDIFNLI